jgi:hypothetical protein
MSEQENASGAQVPCISLLAALKAISDEPEYPGHMPDGMWQAIGEHKDVAEEAMRLTVRLTKEGIRKRIEAAANNVLTVSGGQKETHE